MSEPRSCRAPAQDGPTNGEGMAADGHRAGTGVVLSTRRGPSASGQGAPTVARLLMLLAVLLGLAAMHTLGHEPGGHRAMGGPPTEVTVGTVESGRLLHSGRGSTHGTAADDHAVSLAEPVARAHSGGSGRVGGWVDEGLVPGAGREGAFAGGVVVWGKAAREVRSGAAARGGVMRVGASVGEAVANELRAGGGADAGPDRSGAVAGGGAAVGVGDDDGLRHGGLGRSGVADIGGGEARAGGVGHKGGGTGHGLVMCVAVLMLGAALWASAYRAVVGWCGRLSGASDVGPCGGRQLPLAFLIPPPLVLRT